MVYGYMSMALYRGAIRGLYSANKGILHIEAHISTFTASRFIAILYVCLYTERGLECSMAFLLGCFDLVYRELYERA